MKENILVSACLVGINCSYKASNSLSEELMKLKDKYNFILICPECLGGLTIPRIPSEVIDDKVINKEGFDVTNNYTKGAELALAKALKYNCKVAILKSKSPSCGKDYIYDGTFSKTLIEGDGITTRLLKKNGIKVYSEKELNQL